MKTLGLAALVAASLLIPGTALAQGYPNKPIQMVVPYAPGGSSDPIARLLADRVSQVLSQPVVVENRAGAAGSIGADYVVRSAPDGYTILQHTTSIASEVGLKSDLSYDVTTDLLPVALVVEYPYVIAVSPQLGVNTLGEFIDYLRDNPGEVNYSSAGVGSSGHINFELFRTTAGLEAGAATHIPYAGGGPAIAAVMANEAQAIFTDPISVADAADDGRLVALAVTGTERFPSMPDVPTAAESGLEGYSSTLWNGIFVPAGTPQEAIDALANAFLEVLADPDLQAQLAGMNVVPVGLGPDAFAERLAVDIAKWKETVSSAGITLE